MYYALAVRLARLGVECAWREYRAGLKTLAEAAAILPGVGCYQKKKELWLAACLAFQRAIPILDEAIVHFRTPLPLASEVEAAAKLMGVSPPPILKVPSVTQHAALKRLRDALGIFLGEAISSAP